VRDRVSVRATDCVCECVCVVFLRRRPIVNSQQLRFAYP